MSKQPTIITTGNRFIKPTFIGILGRLLLFGILICFYAGCGKSDDSTASISVTPTVVAKNDHTLALLPDGNVKAWGSNQLGQLGNGTTTNSTIPVTVTGLGGPAVALAAGEFHSIALLADGTVKTWGYNTFGQLGNGNNTSSNIPVAVTGLTGKVTAIAAGGLHSMALMEDGSIMAWGTAISNGTPHSSNVPVHVAGLSGKAVAISAGFVHSVALMSDGSINVWGANYAGQLGNNSTIDSSTPITVAGLGGTATKIATGYCHTVALLSDGTIRTWGYNGQGALGNGTYLDSYVPVSVAGLGGAATAIAAGDFHSMALLSDGTVRTWGNNANGQLGNGATINSSLPVTVSGLAGPVTTISAGWSHSAAISDSSVNIWGDNSYGQLGDGTSISSLVPVKALIDLIQSETKVPGYAMSGGQSVKMQAVKKQPV